ncbi:MAG: cytochrome c biogenesis protein CcsA [Deltaproteobacteria bacterium]|nr:cytochrome c biogenesis protein CcsA [Deltaproteobacteria bacterium]MBW2694887.1 cytochrome c biogenesis protein CcsA [Deltaproteobacteria bacterium]
MIPFLQTAAAIYLAAGVGALLGVALPAPRIVRGAVWGLAAGAVIHGLAFSTLHRMDPVPPLTSLPMAISFTAWFAVISLLLFMWRARLGGLAAVVGPVAFLAVFLASLGSQSAPADTLVAEGSVPHAHVLLSSAGLGLLGVSGLAGIFYLFEHRRLKQKRGVARGFGLPSLEALDRVNVAALAVGFPLLTLGLLTGSAWLHAVEESFWSGSGHASWMLVAWGIYAGLASARFVGRQGSHQAAASAVAGFAFLLFAVVGVEVLS